MKPNKTADFPYPVFGRFTYRCLLWMYIAFLVFAWVLVLGNVHPYQTPVREQPDTRYWKICCLIRLHPLTVGVGRRGSVWVLVVFGVGLG